MCADQPFGARDVAGLDDAFAAMSRQGISALIVLGDGSYELTQVGEELLVGLGAHTGWLVAGRRAVGSRSRAVAGATDGVLSPLTADGALHLADELVVTAERMTLFHRPSCPLVAGRDPGWTP